MAAIVPENTQAILIGASKFDASDDNLPDLPNVKNNLVELYKSLNEVVGISASNIHPILDKDDYDTIVEEIINIIPNASDTLIVYYAGHGIPKNIFYLATKKTKFIKKQCIRAIESTKLVDLVIQETKAKNVIFIIDCCFSARLKESIDTKGKNVFFIVAASSNKTAKDESPDNQDCTAFTHELLEIFEKGIKNAGEFLTFQDISNHLEKQLLDKNLPEPQISSHGSPDKLGICKNKAYKKTDATKYKIPNDLRHHLPNRRPQERELSKAIQRHHNKQTPLICLIHSSDSQCNDNFLHRIIKYYLPTMGYGDIFEIISINCEFLRNIDDLYQDIPEELGAFLLNNRHASHNEIINEIEGKQNCVIDINISTDDWLRCKEINLIHEFIEFWTKFKLPEKYKHLLLVCIRFNYTNLQEKNFFKRLLKKKSLNEEIKTEFAKLEKTDFLEKFKINGVVLPELTDIERYDVDKWVEKHLDSVLDIVQPKIDNLFKSPDATMPMWDLSRELKKILEEFPPDVFRE